MISIFILVLSLIVAFGMVIIKRKQIGQSLEAGKNVGRYFVGPVVVVLLGLVLMLVNPYTFSRVDAGHVGIKVNLTGDKRGVSDYTYKTGWVLYNTWTENLYEFPTFQQHIEYTNQSVITKGGFSATIKPTFNYQLKPEAVGDMFSNLRLDIKAVEQGWLQTAIVGSVNDVANKWTVDDIFNKREEFEAAIITECNKRVTRWFIVSQLRTNITPPPQLQEAINNKTKAIQEAQATDNQTRVSESLARQKIAIAKGDSAQAVISASGRAQAMLIEEKANAEASLIRAQADAKSIAAKQTQLSPLYVEYVKAQKWNGETPTTILGEKGSTFINLK